MPKGVSIHIGLNRVDPAHYGGWDGKLSGCIADAKDMAALAKSRGFSPSTLLDEKATSSAVIQALQDAASSLRAGDILFLTYSGHGGQVTDTNNDDDEEDARDETWCLFDRQLVDDELYGLWGRFEPGTRILVLSDSCHSGSVTRLVQQYAGVLPDRAVDDEFGAMPMGGMRGGPPGAPVAETTQLDDVAALQGTRRMPPSIEARTEKSNAKLYADIQKRSPDGERAAIGATVLLVSGCQDAQLSSDGPKNGLFTFTLKKVWQKGAYRGAYRSFHKRIQEQMPIYQQPNLFVVGPANPAFLRQRPFTI